MNQITNTKFPPFTVEAHYRPGTFSINWHDEAANRRFHIWIYDSKIQSIIHSNWIDNKGKRLRSTHRALSASSKRWAPYFAHIKAEIAAGDLLTKARAEYVEREAECERQAQADHIASVRQCFSGAVEVLRAQAMEKARALDVALSDLSDKQIVAFHNAISMAGRGAYE